jgi:hypothetical protein
MSEESEQVAPTMETDIAFLGNHPHFARLLADIHREREFAISGLYNQGDHNEVMRTTGEIRALDNLLIKLNYDKVLEKWKNMV